MLIEHWVLIIGKIDKLEFFFVDHVYRYTNALVVFQPTHIYIKRHTNSL